MTTIIMATTIGSTDNSLKPNIAAAMDMTRLNNVALIELDIEGYEPVISFALSHTTAAKANSQNAKIPIASQPFIGSKKIRRNVIPPQMTRLGIASPNP